MARVGRKLRPGLPRSADGCIKKSHRGQGQTSVVRQPCSLYVISNPAAGCVKIGVSVAPANRATVIQTHVPGRISISRVWSLGRENAYALERACHKRLAGSRHHITGEWYRLSADTAENFIIKTAAEMGLSLERMAE